MVLEDIRELLHAVARDPAMLKWLDGDENRRDAPNENFARELMELFALGRGAYGERDVQEAARAFTGWGTDRRAARFRPENHDPGPKVVLGRRDVKSAEDAMVALRAGAQLIGCIFAPSKRQCSRDEAQAVVRSAASRSVHRVRTRSGEPV